MIDSLLSSLKSNLESSQNAELNMECFDKLLLESKVEHLHLLFIRIGKMLNHIAS